MDAHSLECLDFYRVRGLLERYALTGLGRSLVTRIEPVARFELIARWHAQLAELTRFSEEHGLPPFGGITDVREAVRRCKPPLQVSVDEMAAIGSTLAGTHDVTRYLGPLDDGYPELKRLTGNVGDFLHIAQRIRGVIDERGDVRDDASPKLARIRAEIRDSAERIRATVERLLRDPDVRRLMQFPNHTFHNDRLVLPLRTEYRGRLPGIIHRSSDSGATIYVEPAEVVELNNQISSLKVAEVEEISRLLWELAHEVNINSEAILKTLDALAILDLIATKLRFARDFGLRSPELVPEPRINARGARHPLLLEMARAKREAGEPFEVVPISYRLGEDFDLLVITGPNTGGKTVTLKTIGLLSLMVQCGLPAPIEEGSQFGVFKRVLIDIGDEQSMQQSLSTFSGHLRRQLDMLQKSCPETLVLMDELGAGTDPDEGSAIGRALLDELLRRRCRCVATTHIGALKSYALSRPRAENGMVEFDFETLRPTYHLRIGEAGMSNAIAIATRLGMPKRLVSAAQRNLSRKARALYEALEGAAHVKRQAERARDAAEVARLDADRALGQADAVRSRLEQQKADFAQWVTRVVHLQPGDPVRVRGFDRDGRIVRVRIDLQRAEVDVGSFAVEAPLGDILPPETPIPPPRPAPPREEKPLRERKPRPAQPQGAPQSQPSRAGKPKREERPGKVVVPSLTEQEFAQLRPGDPIYAKRFHREGTVLRVNHEKRVATISVGLFGEVETPSSGLALPANAPSRRR